MNSPTPAPVASPKMVMRLVRTHFDDVTPPNYFIGTALYIEETYPGEVLASALGLSFLCGIFGVMLWSKIRRR